MKWLLLTILVSLNVQALDSCMTGSWYSPENAGEGINIEVLDDADVLYFYTFRHKRWAWYTGLDGDLYATKDTGDAKLTNEVGTYTLDVIDDDHLTFTYHLVIDLTRKDVSIPWCLSECYGRYEYMRLTRPIVCK